MKNLLKKINGSKDLTEGNPMKLILNFGLPLLFGLLFQQFYNMVDTIIVGKFLGVDALAAVGSTGSINFMILGFCIGICNGFAIPVAQAFGAKDTDNMKKYITNCVWASIFFAAVMTVAVGILTRNILIWMKTPDSILDQAFIYIFIIFMGIPATFLYNMVSGILRSLGECNPCCLSDCILPVKYRTGYPVSSSDGCRRCCCCNRCCTGNLRCRLSDLYV